MGIGRLKKSVLGNIKWSSWEYCSFSKVCACALCWCHYLVLLKTNKVMNECRNYKKLNIQIFDFAFRNNFVIVALLGRCMAMLICCHHCLLLLPSYYPKKKPRMIHKKNLETYSGSQFFNFVRIKTKFIIQSNIISAHHTSEFIGSQTNNALSFEAIWHPRSR